MAYAAINIHRVPTQHVDRFLRIEREAAELYRAHGAVGDATYRAADLTAKYGCATFTDALAVSGAEVVFVGVVQFHDRGHQEEVMAQADADERIGQLFTEEARLLDLRRLVQGEFERVT